jgi:hypothetical protein
MAIVRPVYNENYKFTGEYETIYEGRVLKSNLERYWGDGDYIYYCLVWDDASQTIKDIVYGDNRGGYGPFTTVTVDATVDILAKAEAYRIQKEFGNRKDQYVSNSKAISLGRVVRVVRGNKVALGTIGTVIHMQDAVYNFKHVTKIGIAIDDEKVQIEKVGRKGTPYIVERFKNVEWTYRQNVEVVNPDQFVPTDEEIMGEAMRTKKVYF